MTVMTNVLADAVAATTELAVRRLARSSIAKFACGWDREDGAEFARSSPRLLKKTPFLFRAFSLPRR